MATAATPTAGESVARPVTAAATRSAASQTTSIEGTASKIKIAFFVLYATVILFFFENLNLKSPSDKIVVEFVFTIAELLFAKC